MAEQSSEIVRLEYANQALFAEGNGLTRLFPLKIGDQHVTPTMIASVQIFDWQGQPSLASSNSRTNYLKNSNTFTAAEGWSPFGADAARPISTTVGPNGVAGDVSRIRVGDCTGGATGTVGGIVNTEAAGRLRPGATEVGSMWMRASVPVSVRMSVGDDPAGTLVPLTTGWARVYVTGAIDEGGADAAFKMFVDRNDNPGVAASAVVYFCFSQLEESNSNFAGGPSRYIPTFEGPVAAVDYVVNDGNVIFTQPLLDNATAVWTGSAYWIENDGTTIIPSIDMKVGMTWRLDQSPNLNSLLDSKAEWYESNFNQFWEGWYNSVFRLKTANTFGVAVWAYILGVPLGVLGLQETYRYWGYGPLRGNYRDSWDDTVDQPSSGNFPPSQGGGAAITTPWEKVASLRMRYYALTTNATITSINALLQDVFGDTGLAYVIDNEDMTMTYVFDFPLSTSFQQAMLQYGLLPKPGGVKINIQTP